MRRPGTHYLRRTSKSMEGFSLSWLEVVGVIVR